MAFIVARAHLLVALAVASSGVTPPEERQILTVIARDHSFQAPDTIEAGTVTVRLEDLGPTSPDVGNGRPHVEHGMRAEIRVR